MLKKWCWAVLLGLLLTGCQAQPAWETVDDEMTAEVIQVTQPPYRMTFGVPDEAVLEAFASDEYRQVYFQEDGDYEIVSEAMTAGSIEDVVKEISGFSMDEMTVMKTERGALPEYQFTWYSNSDNGGVISRASVLGDGNYYYTLVFSVQEDCGKEYEKTAKEVFSSFGIYYDEQF